MISIITPVYNGEKHIRSCIESVINQDCDDLEHIIVDGRSKDRTYEIISEYKNRFEHIRCISESDSGQSDAMNKGIDMARGEIIGFLNCDDFYEPHVLKKIRSIFRSVKSPALVVGNCKVWGNDGKIKHINKPSRLTIEDLMKGPNVNSFPENPSAYFYHKSLHNRTGYYDESNHYTMDLDFILRAVRTANVYYFDEIWGNYLWIEGTKTYIGHQERQNYKRVKRVYQKYYRSMNLLDRFLYGIRFDLQNGIPVFLSYNFRQLWYFLQRPKEFKAYLESRFGSS